MSNVAKREFFEKEVGKVYMSYDYGKFTCLDRNRELNLANYRKMIESMKEEHLLIPIIVNQYYQIIDGQHRFFASRELALPIFFIVNHDYGIDQVIRANTVGVNWNKEDFLNSYVKQGVESYLALEMIREEYGINLGTLLSIIAEFNGVATDYVTFQFENGTLKIEDDLFGGIQYFLQQLELFHHYRGYKSSSFIRAFLKLYLYEEYDVDQMEKQVKYMKGFEPKQNNITCILEELCKKVYSFRMPKSKQLFFDVQRKCFYK
jgi:ParB-like nuclease domain